MIEYLTKNWKWFAGGALLFVVIGIATKWFGFAKTWRFKDNVAVGDYLAFRGTEKPPFEKGDSIIIDQDKGADYPKYNGKTKVKKVYPISESNKAWLSGKFPSQWVVEVFKLRKGDSAVNPGVIRKSF